MLSDSHFLSAREKKYSPKIFSIKKMRAIPPRRELATLSPQKYFLAFRARDAEDSKL